MGHTNKRIGSAGPTCVTAGLLICTGKDCRKSKGWSDLVKLGAAMPRSHEVPCQSVCKGPVVGFAIDGSVRWFGRVRSSSKRAKVIAMTTTRRVPGKMADREARKRRGHIRGQTRMHPLDHDRAAELLH